MAEGRPGTHGLEVRSRQASSISPTDACHSALDGGVKLRPTPEELKAIGPSFEKKWQSYYADKPDRPAMWIGPVSMYDPSRLIFASVNSLRQVCWRSNVDPGTQILCYRVLR